MSSRFIGPKRIMDALKEYLVQEFREKAKGFVAVETKFAHTYNLKTDAKSGVVMRNNWIKISLKFVDKNLNTLYSTSIVFENNMVPKRLHKNFVNISPKELENKFAAAKGEICKEIAREYTEKMSELDEKLKNLKSYYQVSEGVIPSEFRGIQIGIDKGNSARRVDVPTVFDM